ncbi:MAG: hypothetical protein RI911_289, partial [Candidatus Parcubacteria bacterium]
AALPDELRGEILPQNTEATRL